MFKKEANEKKLKITQFQVENWDLHFFISQNYTSVSKIISRNCNYIFCFKINDKVSIKELLAIMD